MPRFSKAAGGLLPGVDLSNNAALQEVDYLGHVERSNAPYEFARCEGFGWCIPERFPAHAACRHWLESAVSSDAPFGMSRLALNALVRITTSAWVFANPSTIAEAFGFCDDILSLRHCHAVGPGVRIGKSSESCASRRKRAEPA